MPTELKLPEIFNQEKKIMNEIIVRTDIIDPVLYCKIKLYYENVILKIEKFGGYILYQQFYSLFPDKLESASFRFLKKMEKDGVIQSFKMGNSKYIKLEGVALKYLQKKKNISFLISNPGKNILMKSFYKAQYFINNEVYLESVEKYLEKKEIFNISLSKNLYYSGASEDNYVTFVIFDFGQVQNTYGGLFENMDKVLGMKYGVILLTDSEKRKNRLQDEMTKLMVKNNLSLNGEREGSAFRFLMDRGLQKITLVDYDLEKYFKFNTDLGTKKYSSDEVRDILKIDL